jgi:integrase
MIYELLLSSADDSRRLPIGFPASQEMTMKLTPKTIVGLELPPDKSDQIVWDDDVPGFGLRMRAGGTRAFVFQYKLGDRQRRITLGAASAIDVGRARESAKDLYAQVRLGQDPAGAKAEARIAATETFAAVSKRFLAYQEKNRRPRSYLEIQRHLLKYAAPLHGMQLTKIERRDVASVILAVAENSGTVTSNRVRTSLGGLFTWAMQNGLAETNPVVGTARGREHSRERVLSPEELSLIWRHLGDGHYAAVMQLLMLTGQRASEIADLRWSEIHGDTIVLSPERTKNGRSHIVPISTAVRAVLEAQPHRVGRDLIFGIAEGSGFNGWAVRKQKLDAAIQTATGKALEPWTVHDIRRSVVTGMAEIGIAPHIIEAVVNHVSGHKNSTAGVYNKAKYQDETRAALQRWTDYLLAQRPLV